ncbi:cyclase family protein [Ruminiclostridium josui]|uniref:cyclase family protein n=1 Tax=Ruminiclostridium josui TaxID=1499 RepID=UPI000A5508CB|nr:cyclase family protein [Ruminiclostridium josui]
MKLIDLSHEIEDNMPVYPGDIKTNLHQIKYLSADKHNNHRLDISMHSGTHIDSPMHLTDCNQYISELSLESFIADGCVLDVRNQAIIKLKAEYDTLVKENSIVLLYTGFDTYYGAKEYYENYPCMDIELCKFLIEKNIKMVGMDIPAPDRYPFEIHKLLFKNNIYVMENLTNLDQLLNIDRFEVIAFPLKIKADSSMTRAVARII